MSGRFRSPALALAALLCLAPGCKDVGELPTDAAGPPQSGAGSTAGTVVVEITGFEFRGPSGGSRIEVAIGDTLEFVNRDAAPHTATTSAFDSGRMNQGDRYRVVVSAAGTLALRCDFHPAMTGTIVATEGSGGAGDPGGSGGTGGDESGPGDPVPPDDGSGSGSATVIVEIRDDVFVGPDGSSRIEAATGSTVRFVHRGESPHTATSTSVPTGARAFDSGRMEPGATFEVVVDVAGTWSFRCDFHSGMTGTIVVADGGAGGGGPGPDDPGGSGGAGTVVVTIGDAGFSNGGNVTLTLGGTVEWVNASRVVHELDSTDEPDDAPEIKSGDLAPGARFRFTPDRTGTWIYRCKEHDDERGMRIEVR